MPCIVMLALSVFSLRAQDYTRVKVLFPFDRDTVAAGYQNNAASLAVLKDAISTMDADSKLVVTSFSSPEGNLAYNRNLSLRRAKSMQAFLENNYPALAGRIILHPGEEAWDELRRSVSEDSRLPEETRSAALNIIDSNADLDVKEKELTALPAYKRLYANYFKSLRYAAIELRIENSGKTVESRANSPISEIQDAEAGGKSDGKDVKTVAVNTGFLTIYYALNEDFIRPSYMGNAASMKEIIRTLRSSNVKNMVIEGTASPEGPTSGNIRLANERGENLKNYIVGMFPELEDKITVVSRGENWEGMEGYTKENVREAADALPYARYARIAKLEIVATEEENVANPEEGLTDEIIEEAKDSVIYNNYKNQPVVISSETEKKAYNTVVAVKTNLLYDAVTALNVEVEVPIADRWSVMVEDVFPWWETGNKYCFQLWEMGIEGRYWFKPWDKIGTEKLRGFFVGPYVMSAKYDFQWDKSLNYQGEFWSAGVSAGYSMPIGKRKKANLEFSLSLGYMRSPYRHYVPTDDYSKLIHDPGVDGSLDGTFYNYFLYPTKAKVNLVIPISFPTKKEVSHD